MPRKAIWTFRPSRMKKPRVLEEMKHLVKDKCDEFIEIVLKPEHIIEQDVNTHNDRIVEIYTKWVRNFLYFKARYYCCDPEAIRNNYEEGFARLEYVDEDRFNLSYFRHTGRWWEVHRELTLDECLGEIADEDIYRP